MSFRVFWWLAAVVLVAPVALIQATVFLSAWLLLGLQWSGGMALVTSVCLVGLRLLWRAGEGRTPVRHVVRVRVPRPREGELEWDELVWGPR